MEVVNSYKRARGSKNNNKIVTFEYLINTLAGQIFPSLSQPFKSATFSLLLVNPAPYNTRIKAQSHLDAWHERVNIVWENQQHVQKRTCVSVNHSPACFTRVLNASKAADHRVNPYG